MAQLCSHDLKEKRADKMYIYFYLLLTETLQIFETLLVEYWIYLLTFIRFILRPFSYHF